MDNFYLVIYMYYLIGYFVNMDGSAYKDVYVSQLETAEGLQDKLVNDSDGYFVPSDIIAYEYEPISGDVWNQVAILN